jgi:hypothetical protein
MHPADQQTQAIAEAIVSKRELTILRFSDGMPTEHGSFHPCSAWVFKLAVEARRPKPPVLDLRCK